MRQVGEKLIREMVGVRWGGGTGESPGPAQRKKQPLSSNRLLSDRNLNLVLADVVASKEARSQILVYISCF